MTNRITAKKASKKQNLQKPHSQNGTCTNFGTISRGIRILKICNIVWTGHQSDCHGHVLDDTPNFAVLCKSFQTFSFFKQKTIYNMKSSIFYSFAAFLVATVAICAPAPAEGDSSVIQPGQIQFADGLQSYALGSAMTFDFKFNSKGRVEKFGAQDQLKVVLTRRSWYGYLHKFELKDFTMSADKSTDNSGIYTVTATIPSDIKKISKEFRVQVWRKSRIFGKWSWRTVAKSDRISIVAAASTVDGASTPVDATADPSADTGLDGSKSEIDGSGAPVTPAADATEVPAAADAAEVPSTDAAAGTSDAADVPVADAVASADNLACLGLLAISSKLASVCGE